MARIRSIHPHIFADEAWVSCAPLTRILFFGLLTDADDQGVFEWKPLQIRMRLLPGDNADVAAMLVEMEAVDLIKPFTVGGKRFGAIRNFRKHQRPKKPNAIHPMPPEFRTYVAIDHPSSELDEDEAHQVPPEAEPVPPKSEISPQMEDGGWRMEDGKVSEATASSVASGDDESDFASLWARYPHVKGRSSRPKSEAAWGLMPISTARRMAAAAKRYAIGGTIPPGGAPALQKWIEDELWRDWLDGDPPTVRQEWSGPRDVRLAFCAALGEEWCRSYIDPCAWQDAPDRALIPASRFGGGKIVSDGRLVLSNLSLAVLSKGRAA